MKTLKILLTFAIIFVLIITILIWSQTYSTEFKNLSYSKCNISVVKMFIPPQAQEITGWARPYHMDCVVAFKVNEADYRNWAVKNNWKIEEVRNERVNNISKNGIANDSIDIKEGLLYKWTYNPSDPGSTIKIYAYDRANGIGYFTQLGD